MRRESYRLSRPPLSPRLPGLSRVVIVPEASCPIVPRPGDVGQGRGALDEAHELGAVAIGILALCAANAGVSQSWTVSQPPKPRSMVHPGRRRCTGGSPDPSESTGTTSYRTVT